MIAALTLAMLGGWTSAGWTANPTPVPSAPSPSGPIAPPVPHDVPDDPTPPPSPTNWRLADNSGQAWTSTDKASLEAYVAERNRQLAAPAFRYSAPASSCSTGRCPR